MGSIASRPTMCRALEPWRRVPVLFLQGKTMLVSGLGAIGTEVAKLPMAGDEVVATRVGGAASGLRRACGAA